METKTQTPKPTPVHPKAIPVVTDPSKVVSETTPVTQVPATTPVVNDKATAYSFKVLEQSETICTPFGNVIAPKSSVVVTCGRETYPLSLFAFEMLTEKS